jgi:dihydroorotase
LNTLLLVNGTIVNEGVVRVDDILIRDGRIERIGNGPVPTGTATIDLAGLHVLPGIIDDQVHFREPGMTHKADIGSESLAAICGGVTSYLDMPNNSPPCVDRDGLLAKRSIAERTSAANYGFYLGATNTNIDEIRAIRSADACGIKVFMGASTGNMLVNDEQTLNGIFADAPIPVVTHCEDTPMILAGEQWARQKYGEAVPMSEHPKIRSAEACLASSTLAVELAKRHGTQLHILHLTTARELALFAPGPVAGKRITAEVCVHHLWYDESDYAEFGTLIKCNPSIKTAEDRAALRAGLENGTIDVIATDHAPHSREEKERSYFDAPSGLPLVQHMLPMLLDFCHQGVLNITQVVRKAAHNPAVIFRIRDRGFIREGYHADFAIVDLDASTDVETAQLRYKCGWSSLEGHRLQGSVAMTILGGQLVYDRGRIIGAPRGRALEFGENAT